MFALFRIRSDLFFLIVFSNRENAVNNTTTPTKRQSFLHKPTSRAHHSRDHFYNSLSSLYTASSEKLGRHLEQAYNTGTEQIINNSNEGFRSIKKELALAESKRRITDRERYHQMTEIKQILQQLSERKERGNFPSSITASSGPSSAMSSVSRALLFSDDDVTPSTGNSTLSKPLYRPVVPSMMTSKSQDIDTMKIKKKLKESQAANAVLEQQVRSANVKMEQQDKRIRSMKLPPGHRDVMEIEPTPTEHSERTNESINKAVKTIRRGNRNRDTAPTRRSTRTRSSVQKEP